MKIKKIKKFDNIKDLTKIKDLNKLKNLKNIYNPRQVYEGFFDTYFIQPFFRLYFNFRAHESVSTCIKSVIAWVVITLGIVGIMLGQIGIIGPEGGEPMARIVFWIWGIYSVIPMIGLFVRLGNGKPRRPVRSKMLGVDVLLGVTSLLFFVLGLVMRTTVLQNEVLNPNARMTAENDSNPLLNDEVTEELYTYTDDNDTKKEDKKNVVQAVSDSAARANDPLKDLNEPDLTTSEESYDPVIGNGEMKAAPAPAAPAAPKPSKDTAK